MSVEKPQSDIPWYNRSFVIPEPLLEMRRVQKRLKNPSRKDVTRTRDVPVSPEVYMLLINLSQKLSDTRYELRHTLNIQSATGVHSLHYHQGHKAYLDPDITGDPEIIDLLIQVLAVMPELN